MSLEVLKNILEYCQELIKGEGVDIYSIIFSNRVYGTFKLHTELLNIPFNYEPDGFSKEDDISQLIETMEEAINGIQLSR